jgi:hypothetical protein
MTARSKLYREISKTINKITDKTLLSNFVRSEQAIKWSKDITNLIKNFHKQGHSFTDLERAILSEKFELIFDNKLPLSLYPMLH